MERDGGDAVVLTAHASARSFGYDMATHAGYLYWAAELAIGVRQLVEAAEGIAARVEQQRGDEGSEAECADGNDRPGAPLHRRPLTATPIARTSASRARPNHCTA